MAWKGGVLRIVCRHGHYAFYPRAARDVARFARFFDQDLVRVDDFWTFEPLASLPRYSLVTQPFGNLAALVTYEGRGPWEVMRQNGFVYSLETELLLPKLSIVSIVEFPRSDSYLISPTPLVQAGTRDKAGRQILSFDGEFDQDNFQLKLTGVDYE